MQVEYLVRISLPDDGWDVNMVEEACWKAGISCFFSNRSSGTVPQGPV